MMHLKPLNEIYENWFQLGIFSQFAQDDVPWDISLSNELDTMYFSHSGMKYGNSIFFAMLDNNCHITEENADKIARMLIIRYGLKWKELYKTLSYEYEPLQNYSLTETTDTTSDGSENVNEDGSKTRNSTTTNTGTNTIKNDGTVSVDENSTTSSSNTTSSTGTDNDESRLYGFNSNTAVGDSENDRSRETNGSADSNTEISGTSETTQDSTSVETKNLSNETVESDVTSNVVGSTSHGTKNTIMTRTGMNGSTTFQRMIQHQRNVWAYDFFDTVFNDIDLLITVPIY